MIRTLGFDASTQGAAFATLHVDRNERWYGSHGELETEQDIIDTLDDFKCNGAEAAFPSRAGGWHDVKLVVGIEVITDFGSKGTDEFGARAKAKALLKTQATAHFIRGYAMALGFPTITMASHEARQHLGRMRGATDAMVAQALRAIVPTWPRAPKTNDHHRDAGVVAFAAAQRHGITHGWE